MVTLALDQIGAGYGRQMILRGVTTPPIEGGALTALVGANAAGKSTLFRRIAGQLKGPGTVHFGGIDRTELRYMPQDTAMSAALTVFETIILALKQGGGWRLSAAELAQVEGVLARFDLSHLADRQLPELSGGQRQAVSIAQTLVTRPRIVLMDEPTSALDLYRQVEVLNALATYAEETGAVMLLALHDINQVMRSCRSVIALAGGQVLATGPTLDVLGPEMIRSLYGISCRVERCSRGCPMMIVDGVAQPT